MLNFLLEDDFHPYSETNLQKNVAKDFPEKSHTGTRHQPTSFQWQTAITSMANHIMTNQKCVIFTISIHLKRLGLDTTMKKKIKKT